MTTSNSRPGGSRNLLVIAAVVLVALVILLVLRKQEGDGTGSNDGLTYEQRVAPVLDEGTKVAAQLKSTNTLAAGLQAGGELQKRWQEVQTAAGYDRARHDGFIITFNQFFSGMQSARLLNKILADAEGGVPENQRMDVLFTLQGIHGAETGGALISKTGMTMETLLTRTNLVRETDLAVQLAIEQHTKAKEIFERLQKESETRTK